MPVAALLPTLSRHNCMSFTRLNSYNHDMGLIGTSDFNHGQAPRTGVLLVNLGTPDAPTTAAVRRYLAEFLRDQRVIELSPWVWWPILYGFILNVRPRQSAAAYRKIWTDAGSPLLTISRAQAHGIAQRLQARSPDTLWFNSACATGTHRSHRPSRSCESPGFLRCSSCRCTRSTHRPRPVRPLLH